MNQDVWQAFSLQALVGARTLMDAAVLVGGYRRESGRPGCLCEDHPSVVAAERVVDSRATAHSHYHVIHRDYFQLHVITSLLLFDFARCALRATQSVPKETGIL